MKNKEVISLLEKFAPPQYQEGYDNAGLICGSAEAECKGVLISLDCLEDTVDEAIAEGVNLIVSHHPILFSAIKRLNGDHYVERVLIKAIKADITLYAIHTNLDNMLHGVNAEISRRLGLLDCRILKAGKGQLKKLVTFIPPDHYKGVSEALFESGAGKIGDYDQCAFRVEGTGSFRPLTGSEPYSGVQGKQSQDTELRMELVFPPHLEDRLIKALKSSHPYEEVAYYIESLDNENPEIGAGMIGELKEKMEITSFLDLLKEQFGAAVVRHTALVKKEVQRIALCGGAGSFLTGAAITAGADVFVSADFKYHEFFEADNQLVIADIGHYESEQFTVELLYEFLREKFPNFALLKSNRNTNPVNYR